MHSEIHGDRAIRHSSDDCLGFTPLAKQIAKSIVDRTVDDGFVIGIEGAWGSGKSSLINLIVDQLEDCQQDKPTVVQFRPWLIGNRDALLTNLFAELSKAIKGIQFESGDTLEARKKSVISVAEKLQKYGSLVGGGLASMTSLAGLFGLPYMDLASKIFQGVADLQLPVNVEPPSLEDSKKELDNDLSELSSRIIVIIDDVDRLDATEIAEVLRLVRSVADFKNIIYLLCYDPNILSAAINLEMGIKDGYAFLEKIIQVAVNVPNPEAFSLRRMFQKRLEAIISDVDEQTFSDLKNIIDKEGRNRLKTPRMVNRVLDSLRFVWPALKEETYLPDLVWLHIIKVSDPDLYDWIEKYLITVFPSSSCISNIKNFEEKIENLCALLEKKKLNYVFENKVIWVSSLPGLVVGHSPKYFTSGAISDQDQLKAIQEKRLASPRHWRLYFSLALPTGEPNNSDFEQLFNAAKCSVSKVENLFLSWLTTTEDGNTKLEIVLDRLRAMDANYLNAEISQIVFRALANMLDDRNVISGPIFVREVRLWDQAARLLPSLRQRLQESAASITTNIFVNGRAIEWLVLIFLQEIFNHGIYGDRKANQIDCLMTKHEFENLIPVMHERFKKMNIVNIFLLHDPLNLLFAWIQSGGEKDVLSLIGEYIRSDENLIYALEKMRSRKYITNGQGSRSVFFLEKNTISRFMNYDEVRKRVEGIALTEASFSASAKELKSQFDEADKQQNEVNI